MTFADTDLYRRLRQAAELWRALADTHEQDPLRLQRELRKHYPADLVRAAVELHELRARAGGKFTCAEDMWFTRVGLEQASSEVIARHKARRFTQDDVYDLCCGIGGDTIALAERCSVLACDRSELATLFAKWNARVYGVADRVETLTGDVTTLDVSGRFVHIDPDRRAMGSRRALRIEDYRPGLEFLRRLIASARGGAVKLSPASDFEVVFPGCDIEILSLHGECKEATVWFGEMARPGRRTATVLPSGESLSACDSTEQASNRPLGKYLIDPDAAVKRAGLIDELAAQISANRAEGSDCLTSETPVATPFASVFEIEATYSSDLKVLKRTLHAADVGALEIMPRHVRVDVERLRSRLKLRGERPATLFLLPVAGRVRAVLCRRLSHAVRVTHAPDETKSRPREQASAPLAGLRTDSTETRT